MTTDIDAAYATINDNAKALLEFAGGLRDAGVGLHLTRAFALEYELDFSEAGKFIGEAIRDVAGFGINEDGASESLAGIVDAAASLLILAETAIVVNSDTEIIPQETIPTEEVLEAAFLLFQERRKLTWLDTYTPDFGPNSGT